MARPEFGRGCSSGVEHDLAKVGVEGSNPFARSKILQHASQAPRPTAVAIDGPWRGNREKHLRAWFGVALGHAVDRLRQDTSRRIELCLTWDRHQWAPRHRHVQ